MHAEGKGVYIGNRRIDWLFYADDLALIAENAQDLQRQLRIMEKWILEWNLEVNVEKTEYIAIGGNGEGSIRTEQGKLIRAGKAINYLGYQRKN